MRLSPSVLLRGSALSHHSRTILAIHRAVVNAHRLLACWQLTFFALNAALVVAVDLFRASALHRLSTCYLRRCALTEDRGTALAASLQNELDMALDLLGKPSSVLASASEAIRILKILARAERPINLGKRPRNSMGASLASILPVAEGPAFRALMLRCITACIHLTTAGFGGAAGFGPDGIPTVPLTGNDRPFSSILPLPMTIEDYEDGGPGKGDLRGLFDALKPWGSLFWAAPSREEWSDLVG